MALVKLIYKKGKLRLREIKCLPWGTQLVRGRYAIHWTSVHSKLDPSWSLPCQGKAGALTYRQGHGLGPKTSGSSTQVSFGCHTVS